MRRSLVQKLHGCIVKSKIRSLNVMILKVKPRLEDVLGIYVFIIFTHNLHNIYTHRQPLYYYVIQRVSIRAVTPAAIER